MSQLILKFDPPLDPHSKEYEVYINTLKIIYPRLIWNSGKILVAYTPDEPIINLMVGRDQANRLTWNPDEQYIYHDTIDAKEWLNKVQPVDTEDMFNKLYESEDPLDWAKDLINNMPDVIIPPPDDEMRIIRTHQKDLSREYVKQILDLLNTLGYSFGFGNQNTNIDGLNVVTSTNYLNKGGYIRLNGKNISYGSSERLFVQMSSTGRDGYYSVPNIMI